jgi:signal transduction histidine kinase
MTEKGKELQDALTRLENCCPGSTCDTNQLTSSAELHEALLNLDRARNQEQSLKEELETALTELRQAENALREANDDLEIRVEKRTAELRDSNILLQREINERKRAEKEKETMFAQLLQSQKMESIGLLAGGVAHDFNNILTTILGYSELAVMKMAEDDPLRTSMEDIHAAGVQASALTRQLLAFSRKQIMEIKVINLNFLITNMTKMIGRLIGEHIELQLDLENKLPNIKADPSQIEQILMNMAVNAKDAMPSGGRLTIRTSAVFINDEETKGHTGMKPGSYNMLAIQDTGEGMTQEVQNDIFEPFFTTKVRGKGTGLGLATVYGIVKQHKSYIFVDSEPGQGTLFTIYFPVTGKEAPECECERQKPGTFRQASETVLVVDDDASIRGVITHTLAPLGYKCLKAANGIEALQLVQSAPQNIDLLLTDVVMPGMNGPDLAKLFKKQFPGSKVIFMSGYMSNVDFSDIIALEEAFLQKPLTPTKLLDKLNEVLGIQQASGQEE